MDDQTILEAIQSGRNVNSALKALFMKNRNRIKAMVTMNQGSEEDANKILQQGVIAVFGEFLYPISVNTIGRLYFSDNDFRTGRCFSQPFFNSSIFGCSLSDSGKYP